MQSPAAPLVAIAIAAHPDDIEFVMAGTLLHLQDVGAEIHMWNLANGCYGTATHSYDEIVAMRWQEAQDAATVAGATMHPPITDDLSIMYDTALIAKVAAVIRQVKPQIILTHSPQDYMEDHMNTSRLAVSGAFVRGMTNCISDPPQEAWSGETVIYHGMPHGLRDPLRRLIRPGMYVDVGEKVAQKREMLAQHRSQKEWLDASQGMDSYLIEMETMNRRIGELSTRFEYAEGWRRHNHLGFANEGYDPLADALGDRCVIDEVYETSLDHAAGINM